MMKSWISISGRIDPVHKRVNANLILVGGKAYKLRLDRQDADRICNLIEQEGGGLNTHNMGYVEYVVQTNNQRCRTLVHRLVAEWAGIDTSQTIDHVNGDKTDCRRRNLRAASQHQQLYNRGLESTNKTGYRGVHLTRGKYRVTLSNKGKTEHVGSFDSLVEAARAYDKRARELRGPFARLNFQER